MRLFSQDIGLDLGTANVLLYMDGKGIISREPAVVAVDRNTQKVLKVGAEARNMLGRTPGNLVAMRPLKDGVISDYDMAVRMLQEMFRTATKATLLTPKPRVIICVPCDMRNVEERTLINAAIEAGARRVYLIEEPLAAALGAGLDVSGPSGHLVIDIGAGTTDIAVLSMSSISASSSLRVAGDAFDETIAYYLRRRHGLIIGQNTAEDIKIQIGGVYPRPDDPSMSVRGRDVKNGTPREVTVTAQELLEPMQRLGRRIADEVISVLEETPPELVGDIKENGVTLTGGGSQLWGMDMLLSERLEVPCTIADDPDSCVAYGCGKSLEWIDKTIQEGPINIARNRILKSR